MIDVLSLCTRNIENRRVSPGMRYAIIAFVLSPTLAMPINAWEF